MAPKPFRWIAQFEPRKPKGSIINKLPSVKKKSVTRKKSNKKATGLI